jgi:hypothetical protein
MITVHWTKAAKDKRDKLIKGKPKLQAFIAVTVKSLTAGEIGVPKNGNHAIPVYGTNYKLELEIGSDYVAKIKEISILDIK